MNFDSNLMTKLSSTILPKILSLSFDFRLVFNISLKYLSKPLLMREMKTEVNF